MSAWMSVCLSPPNAYKSLLSLQFSLILTKLDLCAIMEKLLKQTFDIFLLKFFANFLNFTSVVDSLD